MATPPVRRPLHWIGHVGRLVATILVLTPTSSSMAVPGGSTPVRPAAAMIVKSSQITYMTDVFKSLECFPPVGEGWTANLHYEVLYPQVRPGVTHPILFAFKGAAFNDNTSCTGGVNNYQRMDDVITPWVRSGFVVVNVEYHSKNNGLFGDASCPNPTCSPPWDNVADGVAELNLKNAINYFFANDPAQYGADETKGIVILSTSSAANYAFVLGATGPVGTHTIDAVIGWSGLGDPSLSGEAEANYEAYMESTDPSSDRYRFGSPVQRITSASPAIWISSSQGEVVAPESTLSFYNQCVALGISACYLRLLDAGDLHGMSYRDYRFKGPSDPNEITEPPAIMRMTVMQDSLCFAEMVVSIPDPKCA